MVLDDFHVSPPGYWTLEDGKLGSMVGDEGFAIEELEEYLLRNTADHGDAKAKIVHPYHGGWKSGDWEVHIGCGLTKKYLGEALDFLGIDPRETWTVDAQEARCKNSRAPTRSRSTSRSRSGSRSEGSAEKNPFLPGQNVEILEPPLLAGGKDTWSKVVVHSVDGDFVIGKYYSSAYSSTDELSDKIHWKKVRLDQSPPPQVWRVGWNFQAQEANDISLTPGTLVKIIRQGDYDEWVYVEVLETHGSASAGSTGHFPKNYLEAVAGRV